MESKKELELKPNQGLMFSNNRKENDSQPDWRGEVDIEGTRHMISAWSKQSKSGNNFLSLSIKVKQ